MQFSKKQIDFLKKYHGVIISENNYKVSDGFVGSMIGLWWKGETECIQVTEENLHSHRNNVIHSPNFYSIEKPRIQKIIYCV